MTVGVPLEGEPPCVSMRTPEQLLEHMLHLREDENHGRA
jgi:hypothetical protein